MTPCRAEAAAVELLSLAASIDARGPASSRSLVRVAEGLCWVPLVHPLRLHEDRVLAMAEEIRHARATPESLRAFAAELRAGIPEMRRTGWWPAVHGGAES